MAEVVEFENPDLDKSGAALVPTDKPAKRRRKRPGEPDPKMGRPPTDIKWEQVAKMASMFLKPLDIANVLGVSIDTLERACKREFATTFAVWWKSKASLGKQALHRALLSQAIGLEHDGYVRDRNGDIARDPDGYPLKDRRRQRDPNTMVLLYLAKHVLDMEQEGRGYDPEDDDDPDAEDAREGTQTVYPLTFVGRESDEVNETPAPGEEAATVEETSDAFPPITLSPDDETDDGDYFEDESGTVQW